MDKKITRFVALIFCCGLLSCNNAERSQDAAANISDSGEKDQSAPQTTWAELFDGKTTAGWKGFRQSTAPAGWIADKGELVGLGKGGDLGGDIITDMQYEDFELYLEWAISEGGNSGIFFRALEDNYPTIYATGPEYQLIDDIGFESPLEEWQKTGANYAMHNAGNKILKPVGEFNSSRIKVVDDQVEHWLNGELILSYQLWTDDWYARVNNSKWKDYPGYGRARKGHIGLQDHGSMIRFRNVKVADLTDTGKPLFNGQDLEGWKIHGTEKWYVSEGELVCESGPDQAYGYLATEQDYNDFILRLEFLQESNGNSGVFFRSSIDGTTISGWQVEVAPEGNDSGGIYESYGRGWLHQIPDDREHILKEGQWNELVIRLKGGRVMTWLNNEMMTDLTDDKIGAGKGKIALQIHDGGGVKVRWRNIFLQEL